MSVDRPYDELRVVDLTGPLSSYATRLFADLGAEVIMVEPPGGRPERNATPPAGALPYGGADFIFCAAGKKSTVC